MKKKPLAISDHAVLRYLERAGGFEIEKLRADMSRRISAAIVPGAGSVVIDGHRFILRKDPETGETIVATVLEADWGTANMAGRPR